MKTSELSGAQLDWAVFEAEYGTQTYEFTYAYKPSADWAQGGLIIEREWISVFVEDDTWKASNSWGHFPLEGPNPLVAAMRCYVASKLGQEVEIPEELK